jgi:type VI secretion system protein ImpF
VLNYGFRDLSTVGVREIGSQEIVRSIRQSLLDHEPRLVPETVEVTLDKAEGDARQFLSFSIKADLMGDPVDIPMDFTADVDLGAGKLRMSKLRIQK